MHREDDELDTEERALVAKLRDLPPEGTEPDWHALEAAIRAEVGDRAPAPWWRNWRWIVPVWALATTATVAMIVMRNTDPAEPRIDIDAGVVHRMPHEPPREPAPALWLDGEMLPLDEVADPELDALDEPVREALAPDDDVSAGILPVADYGWIDTLDEAAIDAADEWLKRNRS